MLNSPLSGGAIQGAEGLSLAAIEPAIASGRLTILNVVAAAARGKGGKASLARELAVTMAS